MSNLFAGATTDTYLALAGVILVFILVCVNVAILKRLNAAQSGTSVAAASNTTSVDNTIAQIAQKEELVSDQELVAVITAAIAAYEAAAPAGAAVSGASAGAASTNGFVVRSIKRVGGSGWKRA